MPIKYTMERFILTYNGVGSCEALRLRAGYVNAKTRTQAARSPLDTRQMIAGENSQ
jgi:hypothetical protein